jgi:tellurite methyltransferase
MPHPDAERWNLRYMEERYSSFVLPRPFLIKHASLLPLQGLALDVAMGLGGNAGFLLERGLRVVGVDVSDVAVRQARNRLPGLMAVIADMDRFYLPPDTFNVILNFYYLNRRLWGDYLKALTTGGVFIFQTLTIAMLEIQPERDPANLLQPGELRTAFPGLELVDYFEGWETSMNDHPRAVAGLVGVKRKSF